MGLQVVLETSEEVPIVRVAGEVDLATAPQLKESLAAIPAGSGPVIIDLSEVTFLDSTGLSVLVTSWKHLHEFNADSSVRLVVNRPAIQRVLTVTGLDEVFNLFATLEEALKG